MAPTTIDHLRGRLKDYAALASAPRSRKPHLTVSSSVVQLAQLVVLLEAPLAALKAQFVDTRQTQGFFRWLASLLKKATERGMEKHIEDAFRKAVDAGDKLLHSLSGSSGHSDLGGIIG